MTIAIPGPIGKPFDGAEIAEPRAGAVWFFTEKDCRRINPAVLRMKLLFLVLK